MQSNKNIDRLSLQVMLFFERTLFQSKTIEDLFAGLFEIY